MKKTGTLILSILGFPSLVSKEIFPTFRRRQRVCEGDSDLRTTFLLRLLDLELLESRVARARKRRNEGSGGLSPRSYPSMMRRSVVWREGGYSPGVGGYVMKVQPKK